MDDSSRPPDRVRNRDRGQSVVIGFVLVFALVMLLLVVLQATAVPVWNQSVEFSHNERVQGEMGALRGDIFLTAATGRTTSGSISLGTRYPVRPFLVNPGPPSGTISTSETRGVTITNATATGETGDYWDGTTRAFVDRHLTYTPDYNEYTNAPTTGYENGVLYNRQGEREVVLTSGSFVSGRRITLVALNGTLSRGGTRTESLEFQPLSAPQQVTTVRSDGPIEITAATTLSEGTWRELLEDEMQSAGGYVTDVSVTPGDPGTLRVTLAAGVSYDLRMAKVGVGTRLDDPEAHYITTESPPGVRVASGSSELVTFEVRDRYNNPVSGVEVRGELTGAGTLEPVSPVTDENGHATFRYQGVGSGTGTINATFGDSPGPIETATITVESVAVAAGESPLSVEWTAPSEGETDTYVVDAHKTGTNEVDLTATVSPAVEGMDLQYVVSDSSVGTVSPGSGRTDASGQATTTFEATSKGTVDVYAIGGGDADVVTITVVNVTAGTGEPSIDSLAVTDQSKTTGSPKYVQFAVDYAVSDEGGLQSIEFSAVRVRDGTEVASSTTGLSGRSASGSETLRGPDQNRSPSGDYEITVTVVDSDGQTTSETRTVTVG